MTAAEQVSVDALAARMDNLAARLDARFDKIEGLMETRRIEEVRVQNQLDARIKHVDDRVDEYDKAKTVAEAFFSFGKWMTGALVVVLTLVFAYMSTNGHSL